MQIATSLVYAPVAIAAHERKVHEYEALRALSDEPGFKDFCSHIINARTAEINRLRALPTDTRCVLPTWELTHTEQETALETLTTEWPPE